MKIYLVKYLKDGFTNAIEGAYHVLAEDPVDAIKRTQNEWPVKGVPLDKFDQVSVTEMQFSKDGILGDVDNTWWHLDGGKLIRLKGWKAAGESLSI